MPGVDLDGNGGQSLVNLVHCGNLFQQKLGEIYLGSSLTALPSLMGDCE